MKKILGFLILTLAMFNFGVAQPTRVYGPINNDQALTIRGNAPGGPFMYHGPSPTVEFGINVGASDGRNYYGFARWSFGNGTLPPGSTVIRVHFKFRAIRPGFEGHAAFKLFDIKLPIDDQNYLQKYKAMNTSNFVLSGVTETIVPFTDERFETDVTSGPLLDAVQNALNSGRNFVTLGFMRDPEFGENGHGPFLMVC